MSILVLYVLKRSSFVDYENAFDRVKGKDLTLISSLYWIQHAIIIMENIPSKEMQIKHGGRVLSPCLFIYLQKFYL